MSEQQAQETSTETTESRDLGLLAQEYFGDKYHGEANDGPQAETVDDEVQPDGETEDITGESEDAVPEEAAEEVEETETETAEEESEEPLTFADLAAQLVSEDETLPEGWHDEIVTTAKVNGEEVQVSIKDLRESYQMQEAAKDMLERSKAKTHEAAQRDSAREEAIDRTAAVMGEILKQDMAALEQEYAQVDFDSMEPGDRAAKELEFQKRARGLQDRFNHVDAQYQEHLDQRAKQAEATKAESIQANHQYLLDNIPGWGKEAQEQTTSYLVDSGFTAAELTALGDADLPDTLAAKVIHLAQKAMANDQKESRGKIAEKKIKKIPKTLKPGAQPANQGQVVNKEIANLKADLVKSKNPTEAARIAVRIKQLERQKA